MQDNTATRTRDAVERLMSGLSCEDDVYSALVACQTRLNAICWNRFAASHQEAHRLHALAIRRAMFVRRHQR